MAGSHRSGIRPCPYASMFKPCAIHLATISTSRECLIIPARRCSINVTPVKRPCILSFKSYAPVPRTLRKQTLGLREGFFEKKKPVTSASPIWQSADRKGLRRSLVCTTVIISSRWAFRSDGCSARGRAVADAEAGTAFRAIAIRAIAQPHEVNDKSSLSSTPSYERPYPTRFRASFLHLSLR
jgi:hypothetical protein